MNNFLKDALTVVVVAPTGGVSSNDVVVVGGTVGIAAADAAEGEDVSVLTEAVFTLAKATGAAWTQGQPLYWDEANAKATTLPNGPHLGSADVAALSGDTTGRVLVRPRSNPLTASPKTINVMDDDSAASNGTALMVATGPSGSFLASANAGSADSHFKEDGSADAVHVDYNADPASNLGGVQVYFDEDADEGSRLLCVSPLGIDLWVPSVGGRFVRIKHLATAATAGVSVYFDDDAADATERLLFVSPTNEDGTETTSKALSAAA